MLDRMVKERPGRTKIERKLLLLRMQSACEVFMREASWRPRVGGPAVCASLIPAVADCRAGSVDDKGGNAALTRL